MSKQELEELSLEQLLDKLHPDLMVGPTLFSEPEKKYMVCSYYSSAFEYVDGYELPEDKIDYFTYASTAKEVLIKAILEYNK